MTIITTRFGTIDIDSSEIIRIPAGLVGMPGETAFVLLRNGEASSVGWLQSVSTPEIALPVVDAERLAYDYPELTQLEIRQAGLQPGEMATLLVLCPNGVPGPSVNALAPIVVNMETREGAQIVRATRELSTRAPFAIYIADQASDVTTTDRGAAMTASAHASF